MYQAKLRECLLNREALLSNSTCVHEVVPGKLDIKYSIYQSRSWFALETSDYEVIIDICFDSTLSTMSFKKCSVMLT